MNRHNTLHLDEIISGDCLSFMKGLSDNSIDLIVSSPPYNIGKEYEAKRALQHYLDEQTLVLTECARILSEDGSIFWQVGAFSDKGSLIPLDIRIFPILEGLNLYPRNRIVWIRQHGLHGQKKFSCRHETILWFTKSDKYTFHLNSIRVPQKWQNKKHYRGEKKGEFSCHPNGKNPGDIWVFRNVKHNHEEQTIHPCQFPEDLIARIVLVATNEGGIVFDPYMGAGTVAVVARDNRRHFLGCETERKYFDVAIRRLNGTPDDKGYFPNLKTLRAYVERTGEPIEKFRFDVQVGKRATESHKAKIYPEEHHLAELEQRLLYEEGIFSERLNNKDCQEEKQIQGKPTRRNSGSRSLFD